MLDYFAYRMHWRKEGEHPNNKFDPVLWGRRLTQQFAVDAFSRVEEWQLEWYRKPDSQKNCVHRPIPDSTNTSIKKLRTET